MMNFLKRGIIMLASAIILFSSHAAASTHIINLANSIQVAKFCSNHICLNIQPVNRDQSFNVTYFVVDPHPLPIRDGGDDHGDDGGTTTDGNP